MSRPQSGPRTRSNTVFEKLVETSRIGQPLGHASGHASDHASGHASDHASGHVLETPQNVMKHLLMQYNKKNITKEELSHEINMLLRTRSDLLPYFREEFRKNNLNIALKNNFVQNSPYYTIKPVQKRVVTRRTIGLKRNSKTRRKSVK